MGAPNPEDRFHEETRQLNQEYLDMYNTVGRGMFKLVEGRDPGPLPADFFDDKGGL